MKYIIYISLLLVIHSCKTKKTVETPASKLWQSGIDTITLPDNNAVLPPPYGDEEIIDTQRVLYTKGARISMGWNTISLKSGAKKHHKKRDWVSLLIGSKWQEKPSELYEDSVGINNLEGIHLGVSRIKLDSSIANAYKRHFITGVTGDSTEADKTGVVDIDTVPFLLSYGIKITSSYSTTDTFKVIVSYVDTSVEARPNAIDWKYLYYVRSRYNFSPKDSYYLDLDKKRIKSSIVVLEARILDPKP